LKKTLKVVSTFSIINDFARSVGGDRIALTTLLGPDGEAHSYEPRPTDATTNTVIITVNMIRMPGGRLIMPRFT